MITFYGIKNSYRIYLLKVTDLTEHITIKNVNQYKKKIKIIYELPINQPN